LRGIPQQASRAYLDDWLQWFTVCCNCSISPRQSSKGHSNDPDVNSSDSMRSMVANALLWGGNGNNGKYGRAAISMGNPQPFSILPNQCLNYYGHWFDTSYGVATSTVVMPQCSNTSILVAHEPDFNIGWNTSADSVASASKSSTDAIDEGHHPRLHAGASSQLCYLCADRSLVQRFVVTEATSWLINGSRVMERLNESSGDPTTTALLCQSVSYSADVLYDMKFQGVVMAYSVVLMNYGLACTASIPTPD
jgi:hypothetical protein